MYSESDRLFIYNVYLGYYIKNASRIFQSVNKPQTREWAFQTFDNVMLRHKSFGNQDEFIKFLKKPMKGVFYSASYYKNPDAEMENKGRVSTDLIFDLDADHISNVRVKKIFRCKEDTCSSLSLKEKCEICGSQTKPVLISDDDSITDVAKELMRLLDRLNIYFGIGGEVTRVFFSGSRGFHIHIEDSPIIELDDIGRIELKDFITLDGIDIFNIRNPNSYLATEIMRNMNRLVKTFVEKGVPRSFIHALEKSSQENIVQTLKRFNNELSAKSKELINEIVKTIIGIDIDPAVTTDLSRLIRAPYSLHGKTCLVKKEVNVEDSIIDGSDVISSSSISSSLVKVHVALMPTLKWGGEQYGPYEDEDVILPESLAIYLVNLGVANSLRII